MTEAVEDVGTNALAPDPAPVAENLETAAAPEVAQTEVLETEPAPEPVKEHGNKGKTPWYMERINEETNKRREIETQLEQARRERTEAQALAERLQGGDKEAPRARTDEPDIEALVEARASQKLFNQDCNDVAALGQASIPDFNQKLADLRSVGVVSDDFLKDIFAVDKANAHKILDNLAQDLERANMMTRMDSRKRIAELTRMNMAEAVKPAAPIVRSGVSKVPAPKPIVEAVTDGSGEMDLANDKLDNDTWSKLWDKKYKKRA